jgi:FkbM family methyltransferase
MNPIALLSNTRQSIRVCPTWGDRLNRLFWLYHDKRVVRMLKATPSQRISFNYSAPVKSIRVLVRDNLGSDAFVFGEVFDHLYYDFVLPEAPQTILDLGANAGFTTIFFARKYPQAEIASVEPIAENLEVLRENLALNGVAATVFAGAVATEDGYIEMTMSDRDYGHKVAGIAYGKTLNGPSTKVQAISVPTIIEKMNWTRIGLLKVDIEGYEAILLKERCDWLALVDAMCIECHEGYDEGDLREVADRYGFENPKGLPGIWLLTRAIVH